MSDYGCCRVTTGGQHEDDCPVKPKPAEQRRPQTGWICPKCGRGNAIWLATCPCGPDINTFATDNTNDWVQHR